VNDEDLMMERGIEENPGAIPCMGL